MIHICLYSFGKDAFINACIESIYKSDLSTEVFIDLYVYTKYKSDILKLNQHPNMEITFLNNPKTYSWVTNTSLRKAISNKTKYFLLLNTDTVLHPLCISYLIKTIDCEKIGVVGGLQTEYLKDWETPNQWTKGTVNESDKKNIQTIDDKITLHVTPYVQGACMLFKTALIHQVGLFNERFKLFYEETEFCRRVSRQGYIVGVVKEAKVKHYGGGSWKKSRILNLKRDVYYLANQIMFEATSSCHTYMQLLGNMIFVVKKQFKNIIYKEDNITLPFFMYPLVLISILFRIDLLLSLYNSERAYDRR